MVRCGISIVCPFFLKEKELVFNVYAKIQFEDGLEVDMKSKLTLFTLLAHVTSVVVNN